MVTSSSTGRLGSTRLDVLHRRVLDLFLPRPIAGELTGT